MVINTDWITDSNQNQMVLANAAGIVSGQNANSSTIAQDLNDQITKLNSQISDLNSQITSLKKTAVTEKCRLRASSSRSDCSV